MAAVQNEDVEALLAGRGGIAAAIFALVAVRPETIRSKYILTHFDIIQALPLTVTPVTVTQYSYIYAIFALKGITLS